MLLPNDGIQKNAELMGIYPLHGVKDDYIVVLEDVFFPLLNQHHLLFRQ